MYMWDIYMVRGSTAICSPKHLMKRGFPQLAKIIKIIKIFISIKQNFCYAVALKTPLCSALEIKWNAINLKCGNKLSSCDVDFYSQNFREVRWSSIFGTKAFQGYSEPRYMYVFWSDMYPVYGGCLPTVCCVYCLWLSSLSNKALLKICLDIYEAQEMLYFCS